MQRHYSRLRARVISFTCPTYIYMYMCVCVFSTYIIFPSAQQVSAFNAAVRYSGGA